MPSYSYSVDLPVNEAIPSILEKLAHDTTLILKAPPGAGKSTVVPLALLNEPWLEGKKIIVLEPRRLAAKTVAARMASLLNDELGNTVGYRIRFETKVSKNTRIEVVTEGILTRMLQADNAIEDVGLVIFDEFHERSIHADVALALCREAQTVLRPDLRLLIMSATIDLPQLSNMLSCDIVESLGRQYPVDIKYVGDTDAFAVAEYVARTVVTATKETQGDILVFLPGQGEIKKCEELLRKEFTNISIHPLYGQLSFAQQQAAILPNKNGQRKVVLATSIAETSLTIEGITTVVDCGFTKTSKFDPKSGLSRLETVRVSVDSADQRAGRAGRLSAGTCYRMWSKATQHQLTQHHRPEIEDADLCSLVLEMAMWGIDNIFSMAWLSPPPRAHVDQAFETLHQLDALQNYKVTEHGKAIHALPCHPRIAHMLIMAQEIALEHLATDIAAVIEERDPLVKEAGVDLNIRVEALRRFRNNDGRGRAFGFIDKVAQSYRTMMNIEANNDAFDPYETGILLAYAYPERIAFARPGNNAQFQLANGKIAFIGHKDDLAHEPWLAVAHIDARDGMGKIFMASPLNPKDLAPLVKEVETIQWNQQNGEFIASKDLKIGSIVLRSTPLVNPDPERVQQTLCDIIEKQGAHFLDFNDKVVQFQHRVLSLRKWNGHEWPDLSTDHLLRTCSVWLKPYLTNIKKKEDFKKIDVLSILENQFDYNQLKVLNSLAPDKIKVPSDSMISIQYFEHGEKPVLAVRLQELFGLRSTPTINQGKTSLVLHLLSPGFKPVQITSDLESFWNHAYHDVKKDLKRRYPKHAWPEDPWTAQAVRGVKKK